jgi:putative heme transporter
MSEKNKSFFRANWRWIVTIITSLAMVLLGFLLWDQIVDTFRNLNNLVVWFLLIMIPLQIAYYHISTIQYLRILKILGNGAVRYFDMLRITIELTFVNAVFPSGGISGFSYFGITMRQQGVTAAKAALVQTMRFITLFVSFQLLLLLALVILGFDGRVNNFLMMTAASLSTLLIFGSGLFIYIIRSRSRINSFFTNITRALNKLITVVARKNPEPINIGKVKKLFNEYHDNYGVLRSNIGKMQYPLFYGLLINIIEILTVYVVFLAFGQTVNLGAVILAYAVANFAGLVSVLPGGVGIYEGLMVAVLVAGGVPAAVSLPVIITYRILNTLLQVPVGGIFYYKRIHSGG